MKKQSSTPLRAGYTTGACAAAASRGAALMLRDQCIVADVSIQLPAGVSATFRLEGQSFSETSASCFIIKDAGDDPDITNGAEVHALVTSQFTLPSFGKEENGVVISGGTGIGKATKPGLAVAPGEWAINPVPRRMIREAVDGVISTRPLLVEISIPDGEERAQKTLNARLGILGGLSILGTTGIVRPISAKAWTDTIDTALDVARACGCKNVVFSTGRTSELAAQKWFEVQGSMFDVKTMNHEPQTTNHEPFPEEAYVMMGDHVAHALRSARQRGYMRPVIACQFAKLVKIACGYENTHAAASEMDLVRFRDWAAAAAFPSVLLDAIAAANTAREIALLTGFDPALMRLVAQQAFLAVQNHVSGIEPVFMVADYSGRIVFHSFPLKING
ncbi:MAG: cobalamin biosynthesis protein CbiD [Desulfuromonadales bacterium]|nr:cobalamin biosynthesis protein CbiD [Desulfuromonadales bacterium]